MSCGSHLLIVSVIKLITIKDFNERIHSCNQQWSIRGTGGRYRMTCCIPEIAVKHSLLIQRLHIHLVAAEHTAFPLIHNTVSVMVT